jgi:hypothetical protein
VEPEANVSEKQGEYETMGPATKINAATIVKRAKDVLFSQLDDELLAIDAQAGYCYSLNETAGRVWELIATPMPISALCAQLRQEFAVDEAACQQETLALVQALYDAELAQVIG